jgi:hypothetical protein
LTAHVLHACNSVGLFERDTAKASDGRHFRAGHY